MKKWILLFLTCFQWITLNAQDRTVVCIHGILADFRSMYAVKGALRSACFDVCLWDYPSRRGCIQDHACELVTLLQQMACCNPGQPIDFVAHSIGALVLRRALNLPGCPQEAKIGRAALLAPPNRGSELGRRFRNFPPVRFALGDKSGLQLLCYDACDIMAMGSFPPSMQVLVIAGDIGNKFLFCEPNDGYLTVQETALDTPFYWAVFPVNHSQLLTSRRVLCCMKTFLLWGYPEPSCEDPGTETNADDCYAPT